jgi:large subunit ribosomal protein L6
MSRIGKLPIKVESNIKVSINNNLIFFDNGKVKKEYLVKEMIKPSFEDNQIILSAINKNDDQVSMFIGMDRSNIKNIIDGLQNGFKKTLEINGVGYKAIVDKRILILTLGYSHEIFYHLPEGISVVLEKPNLIIISGDDKILVGQTAAEIIAFRKPEPYKGKGVKVFGKRILRKEGKKK